MKCRRVFFEETQLHFLQPSTHRITTPQPSFKLNPDEDLYSKF